MKLIFTVLLLILTDTLCASGEKVVTHSARGHLIHNTQVFSSDGRNIVFDSRNDETQLASSSAIGMVNLITGEETTLYQSPHPNSHGPGVGAATFSPVRDEVIFIHGLDPATESKPYGPSRRTAAIVSVGNPGKMTRLDARDVSAPFTPGALRGGTHAHQWSGDGKLISFTYNDAVIPPTGPAPADLRTVGVMVRDLPVRVVHPLPTEEFSGLSFSVVVIPVTPNPKPGSDEISRAYEEGWVGTRGYMKSDGSRQAKAIAFIGNLTTLDGKSHSEVFIADLPDDLTKVSSAAPLEGTSTTLPAPPAGVNIRRLTHTDSTPEPGLQGPRHWVRVSPDGKTIAFLDQDENGIAQIFGVSPNGGSLRQLSQLKESVDCPFSWSPDGKRIACSAGGRVRLVDPNTGRSIVITEEFPKGREPKNGISFSPDGSLIAFNRLLPHPDGGDFLQVCVVGVPPRGD